MKVIGVLALVFSIAALLSYGPGVPTQNVNTGDNSQLAAFIPANSSTAQLPTVQNTNANPKHGQPGHRCDIKVGAPLNSQPTIPAKIVVPASTVLPIIPADGLNPKHGQPGHRCDIAVGAPLNSKPAAATPPSAPVNTTPLFNNVTTSSTAATGTPPRLNPKHGQPFHRCDIMVGQPLNSKATIPPIEPKTAIAPAPVVSPLRSAANTAAPLLNPKHGQPGHRCDILVGQPLNGKPAYTLPSK